MLRENFDKKIQEYAHEMKISLTNQQINQFYNYMKLLLEWNEKINLTAITDPEEIILKHFIDSMTLLPYIEKNKKVVDVGTGAGFPGIPLKIMREDIEIIMIDSLNKRIHFLEEVITQLGLIKINAIHSRAEEFARNKIYREQFDIATSRAVANLSTLSEYLIPLVKIGGSCICMKSAKIEQELKKAENAIFQLGGKVEEVETFLLPKSDIERSIVFLKKEKSTPMKYPRKAGIPVKNPIN